MAMQPIVFDTIVAGSSTPDEVFARLGADKGVRDAIARGIEMEVEQEKENRVGLGPGQGIRHAFFEHVKTEAEWPDS